MNSLYRVEQQLNELDRSDRPVFSRARMALRMARKLEQQAKVLVDLAFASYRKGEVDQFRRFALAAYELSSGVERVRRRAKSWFVARRQVCGFPRVPQPAANWGALAPVMPWRPGSRED